MYYADARVLTGLDRDQLRRWLHLLVILSMVLTNLTPLLLPDLTAPLSFPSSRRSQPVAPLPVAPLADEGVNPPVPFARPVAPASGDLGAAPLALPDALPVLPARELPVPAVAQPLAQPGDLGSLLPSWYAGSAASPAADTAAEGIGPGWRLWTGEPLAASPALPDLAGSPVAETWQGIDTAAAPAPAAPRSGGEEDAVALAPAWFMALSAEPRATRSAGLQATGAPAPTLQPAAGVCAPASQLDMTLTLPPYAVSRGNTAGDVYTVTVRNQSAISTTEVSLLINPNQGFYYLGGSATATSSYSGTLSYIDTGTGAPDATATITLTGDAQAQALEPGEVMTFTFRLATNADAISAQFLTVQLLSGSPSPISCKSATENVPTVRGNLTVQKSPQLQSASFGDTITWTVTLRNTGLGVVYGAQLTDTIGSGYANVTLPPATPVDLAVGENFQYVVTATVASCTNLTNTVAATWSIGNADGTGTSGNPVTDEVDVLFSLEDPAVSVTIGELPTVSYCGSLDAVVPVTVTNTGGAARNLRLQASVAGATLAVESGPWVQSGNQLIYTGGVPAGTLRAGETLTFTVRLTTANLCAVETVSLDLTPVYQDACQLLEKSGTPGSTSQSLAQDSPTLDVTKSGPQVVDWLILVILSPIP